MGKPMWVYRPSEKEHEEILKFRAENPEFTSMSSIIREAVLRFIYSDDISSRYTEIEDVIESLRDSKEKFLDLVLDHSGGM